MNSVGMGGSPSTGVLFEAELDDEGAGEELLVLGVEFDESLHPNRKKRAMRAMSLPNWINDIAP